MSYNLVFSQQAQKDIEFYKKSGNTAVLRKILSLLNEIAEYPYEGSGKPEPLKYSLAGCWSRRINLEHRLVYEVSGNKILIHSAKGHYF